MQPKHRDAFRLAAHLRACAALRVNPVLLTDPRRFLIGWVDQAKNAGQMTDLLNRWGDLLAVNERDPQALNLMCSQFCEDSPVGRELRLGSPLLFVLSQPELRQLREEVKRTSS